MFNMFYALNITVGFVALTSLPLLSTSTHCTAPRSSSLLSTRHLPFPSIHTYPRTPPQNLTVPLFFGWGSKPSKLVLSSSEADTVSAIYENIPWFRPNESSTFTQSSDTTPVTADTNITGIIAHDVVGLNGITLPNQELGTYSWHRDMKNKADT